MILFFTVDKQIITRRDNEKVVRDSQNYLYINFSFSEDWTGTKTAVFKGKSGNAFNVLIDENGSCLVPWEVLTEEYFEVSAFCGDLITANVVKVFTIESGYAIGEESRTPTPDIYAQIIARLSAIEAEIDPTAIQQVVDEYLSDKGYVTEQDVEQIVADYIEAHKDELKGDTGATGPQGPQGVQGPKGDTGEGVAAGGTTGQVLVKSSNADYATKWRDGVLNVEYSNDVSKITLWENGTIDYKGQLISGNTRLRNSQYLDATNNLIIHINDENYEYGICLYSDIDTQIETEKFYFDANTNTNVQYVVYYQRDVTGAELLEAFPSLKYIKVVMRNVQSETTISPSDYDKITLDYKNDTYSLITYLNKISKIITESSGFIKIKNAINSLAAIWAKWNGRLAFGMDTTKANVPLEVDGQIYAEGTIIAHNGGTQATNRWGAHIYEGYAKDNYSRMTMLLDKHPSEVNGKPSLEYYYYTGAGHTAKDYGNTKIGSDAQYHSFYFNRDEFICVGLADFRFPITLWGVDPSGLNRNYSTVDDLDAHVDAETQADAHLSSLRYIYLKNAANGTMFYDTARNKVVCKINGAWCDLAYTDASSNYSYL